MAEFKLITDKSTLCTLLTESALVITPNNRLTLFIAKIFQQYQQQQHLKVWHTPQIVAYNTWIKNLWQQLLLISKHQLPMLLNDWQTTCIWERIISADHPSFINGDGIINAVKSAWEVCNKFSTTIQPQMFELNLDTQTFMLWAKEYQAYLKQHNLIDVIQLPDVIRQYPEIIEQGSYDKIIISGFDETTPQFNKLLDFFAQYNFSLYQFETSIIPSTIYKKSFDTSKSELSHAINWLKQHSESNDKIACVIPDLSMRRAEIERALLEHFNQEQFNISIGKKLNEYAIIGMALKILSFKISALTYTDLSNLLISPYIGSEESEFYARCKLDKYLNELGISELSLTSFIKQLAPYNLIFSEQLQKFKLIDCSGQRKPSEWSQVFKQLLSTVNWPGYRNLNSFEYQIQQRWQALYLEYNQADLVIAKIDFKSALNLLFNLVAQVIFQPQARSQSIHILGLLEAAGLEFDKLWVMGLNDNTMPAAAKPNPFIPYHLQCSLNMPHASSAKELAYGTQLLQRLSGGAQEVTFSYAKLNNNLNMLASPLLDLFEGEIIQQSSTAICEQANILEIIIDDGPLPVTDLSTIRGGTFILKDQAICPFRSFARHRLKLTGWDENSIGLDDADRGLILHRLLEHFWQHTRTQQTLLQYTTLELSAAINSAIEFALEPYIKTRPDVMNKTYISLEIQRLFSILQQWLDLEKQRSDFTVVSQEAWTNLTINNLDLKMRVDRIDQLANGSKVVIDYKTGQPNIQNWFEERCSEPQLPLYALADHDIRGLVYAQLKAGSLMFKGIIDDNTMIPGTKSLSEALKLEPSWEELRQQWQDSLDKLSYEFLQGVATIAPKDNSACNYCEFQGLCRYSP